MGGVVLYQDMVRQHFVMVLAAFFYLYTPSPLLNDITAPCDHADQGCSDNTACSAELRSGFYNDFCFDNIHIASLTVCLK